MRTRTVELTASPGQKSVRLPSPDGGPGWLISTIGAGDMSLSRIERRREFFGSLGIDPDRVKALVQVHSRDVLDAARLSSGPPPDGDGLVTVRSDTLLSVTVADCLPVLIFDSRSGAFALCHSGWRGTGIVRRAFDRMRSLYGTRPADLAAVLGPGIGSCCYAVPRERYEAFVDTYGPEAGRMQDDRWFVDLRAANRTLVEAMDMNSLTVVSNCTACTPWLSSYRRQGRAGYVGMVVVAGHELSPAGRRNGAG